MPRSESRARRRFAHALADLERHALGRVAQQDHELLAAVASRDVVVADRPDDRAPDRLEHDVAGGVAEAVVEELEPIDVDHEHADAVLCASALGQQPAELVEVASVRQAGEGVGRGLDLGRAMRAGP
jgi:hypothetical protein